jgi:AtzE family amidohydrolase
MKSALEIARGVRGGTLRAVDVIAGTLARIDALDAEINAFTSRLDAKARCDATAIDDAIAAGRDPGPLAGVPFAVKNLYDIAGVTTIAGARIHAQRPPAARDATLVQRLKASGAILVGAVNMDAYAYGFTTENTHYGATRNPHDTRLTAGGSSGGSAAAVAAAMVPLTLGSDTNGSIRVPASFCGVFGLRPTFGRLSRTGTLPFVHDLDVLGPFAASAADLALAYDATCGPDQEDPVCSERDWTPLGPTLAQGIDGLRIAVCDGFFEHPLDPHARSAVQLAASALSAGSRSRKPSAPAPRHSSSRQAPPDRSIWITSRRGRTTSSRCRATGFLQARSCRQRGFTARSDFVVGITPHCCRCSIRSTRLLRPRRRARPSRSGPKPLPSMA